MSKVRLTPTSYLVLGLISAAGEATPYQLKQQVAASIGSFWSVPHAQLYREPERLAKAGLLDEKIERSGRRRKLYKLTAAGRKAFEEWLGEPTRSFTELRDPGLLQLFLGAEPVPLARAQREEHRARLGEYEGFRDQLGSQLLRGMRLVLDSGIGHEREWVRFWESVARRKG